MQDINWMSRNFATLELLGLQPPFTRGSILCVSISYYTSGTGQTSITILSYKLAVTCVFVKQSLSAIR